MANDVTAALETLAGELSDDRPQLPSHRIDMRTEPYYFQSCCL